MASNDSNGECRFCRSSGTHRRLDVEYFVNGEIKRYNDLFYDCFNICLSTQEALNLICSSCILQLVDAYCFREMVMVAESRLLDPLLRTDGVENTGPMPSLPEIKVETVKMEIDDSVEFELDPHPHFSDDHPEDFEFEDEERLVKGEADFLKKFSPAPPLPRAPHTKFQKYLDKLKGLLITSKEVEIIMKRTQYSYKKESQYDSKCDKRGIIVNACILLENSNMVPFRSKTPNGFPCFYCRLPHGNIKSLREHVAKEHDGIELKKVLWKYGVETFILNMDITDLKCTICDSTVPSITELKKHLTEVHKKQFSAQINDRLIPFKLTGGSYACQICGAAFETFGSVERHMNVHFRNYVCKECGSGFVTKYRLKVHIKGLHVGGHFPCEICLKVFASAQKLKIHTDSVHKMLKRFRCPTCSERFSEYFARQKHMVQEHGANPIKYKCNVCDKQFDRRYALSRHLKKDHLREKNNECEVCGYRSFTIAEMRMHMVKHVGERIHVCSVCKKSYARKKTLTEHMKIHTNDRRHCCQVCGQAFIQKCSLKGHIKTHHPELVED